MIEAFLSGLESIITPIVILALIGGAIAGAILGIIPGLSSLIGIVLILPFIFGQDPVVILPLLCAILSVGFTGGSLTAILIGIPGQDTNTATLLDGFPMTRKGEGARAVGASLTASTLGGIASVLFAFGMIPLVIPLVINFRTPEMLLLILLGLTFLAALSRGSAIKGMISAGLGLLVSTIGFQAKTGASRFTFGSLYLYDGIDPVVMILGLFAIPILVQFTMGQKSISPVDMPVAETYIGLLKGMRDTFRNWWLWLRSTVIGYIIGVLPGIGAVTAMWVVYSQAKQSSKNPEKFGTGCVEGVIAPESANNAVAGGSVLTTLAFGIPGSGTMVLLLAALLMLGIVPGPKMFMEQLPLCFTMLISIAVANVVGGIVCFGGIPFLTKITRIPTIYLFITILPIIYIAIYSLSYDMLDIIMLLVIGVISILLGKCGFPLPPIILGFILGGLFELYLWHSIDLHGFLFFTSPISLSLLSILVIILTRKAWSPLLKFLLKKIKS